MTDKISPFQFYSALFLGRLFATVTYAASIRDSVSPGSAAVSALLSGVFFVLLCVPTAVFIKMRPRRGLLEYSSSHSRALGAFTASVVLVDSLFFGMMTCARFELLASSVMFPGRDMLPFTALFIAVGAFASLRGIETLARSAALFLPPVIFATAFVLFAGMRDFDRLNFTRIGYGEAAQLCELGLYSAMRSGEISCAGALADRVRGNSGGRLTIYALCVAVFVALVRFIMTGVLGSFENTQLFSMYSLSVHARLGVVERLDSLVTCVWLVCAGVRLSLTLYTASAALSALTLKRRSFSITLVCALIIAAGTAAVSRSVIGFADIVRSNAVFVISFLSCVCVPVAALAAEKIKGRRSA